MENLILNIISQIDVVQASCFLGAISIKCI